jgi:intracellular multiplication protein IcmE
MVCSIDENFDDQDVDFEDTFDDFGDAGAPTKKPIPKIAIIGGAILLIIVVIFLFGGSEAPIENSVVRGNATVKQDLGTEALDPTQRAALEMKNADEKTRAVDAQDSFIPIPVSTAQSNIDEFAAEEEEVDPLQTWKAIQDERMKEEQFQQSLVTSQGQLDQQKNVDAARQQALQELANAMSEQMGDILDGKEIQELSHMEVTDTSEVLVGGDSATLGGDSLIVPQGTAVVGEGETVAVQLLPATTIEYAQTLTEANSDVEGPVLAEIVTGPLAGARVLGSFTKEEEYLVIEFTTAVKDGVSYPINAIVLDPETTLPAIVTDIDRRWFRRVILPAAASFIEGLGSAIATTSGTTVSVEGETVTEESEDLDTEEELGKAFEKTAQKLAEIIDDEGADVETLVKVKAGTPIGLLFLAPVFEPQETLSSTSEGVSTSTRSVSAPGFRSPSNIVNGIVGSIQ